MKKKKIAFINEQVLQILKLKETSSEERFRVSLILYEKQKITEELWKQLQKMGSERVDKMAKEDLISIIEDIRGRIVKEKKYPWNE